jgi:hypothetical protein
MYNTFTQEGYSQKARGTHARVQRVKVTPVPRVGKPGSPLPFEKPSTPSSPPPGTGTSLNLNKNCVRCKESANCVKTLQTKLGKIEQLVRHLETTTTKYTEEKVAMHQPPPPPPQPQQPRLLQHYHRQRLARLSTRKNPPTRLAHRGIDLSKLDFTEFQKLVAVTTNTPFPIAPTNTPTIITKLSTTEPMIDVKPTPAIHSDPQHYHISGGGKSDPDEEITPSSPALSSSTITSQITSTSTNATNNVIGHQSPPITAAMALKRQKSLRKDSGYTSDSDREHSNAPSRKHTLSSGLSHAESNNNVI